MSRRSHSWPRRTLVPVLALLAALAGMPGPAQAVSTTVVISEFRVRGPNGAADEFVELYNLSSSPVDIGGWKVRGSNNSGFVSIRATISAGTTLSPGCHFLVTNSSASGGPYSGPVPGDQTYATGITDDGGIAVTLPDDTVVDQVGMSAGSAFKEGTPLASLGSSNLNRGYERKPGGAAGSGTDTDNNASDFQLISPSDPQNLASGCIDTGVPTDPSGQGSADPSSVEPGDTTLLTVAVTPGTNPTSTGITVTGDLSSIGGSGSQPFFDDGTNGDVTGGDDTFSYLATVDPGTSPGPKTLPLAIADAEGRTGSASIDLTVEGPPVPIYELQGTGHTSPYAGTEQTTTGVVTVVLGGGFFLQDPEGDGDPATSDGIFVFTGSSLARTVDPGDELRVRGTVTEFRPSSRPRDLTLTEITTPVTLTELGTGAALPDPVLIDDRPDTLIHPDGIDAFERLEGMLVEVDAPVVVGPTNAFGELVVVASGDASHTTPSGNILVEPLGGDQVDYNPERIMVDDEARVPGGSGSGTRINNPMVQVAVGDAATGNIVGAMDYQFSNYRVQAGHAVSEVLSQSTASSPVGGLREAEPYEGRIATFNVENLFDCVDAPGKDDRTSCSAAALAALETQLSKLAAGFEQELLSPEIVIIEETENTEALTGDANGFVPGTSVPALLPRISGNWDAVSFDASDERGIEVAFVYNTDRVTLDDAFLSTDVLPDAQGVFDGSVFGAGREPLVGFFTLDDVDLILIGNHLKSKGGPQFGVDPLEAGDDPLYGAFQPPTRWTEVQIRHKQADYLRDLVDLLLAESPGANLAVGGDLNDFAFPEPGEGQDTVARIADSPTDPLTNVIDLVPADSRYTFVFEGNSQVLDHLLIEDGMAALLTDQGIAHFNASYPVLFGDDPSTTIRSSDHDPLVGYFCTDATAPSATVEVTPDMLWPPNHKYRTVEATVTASDDRDPAPTVTLVSVTSNEPDDAPGGADGNTTNDIVIVDDDTFRLRAERSETGTGRVYTITYQVTDACGNSSLATATVTVPISRR